MEIAGRTAEDMLGLTCRFGVRSIALFIRGLAFFV